jgi:hypothetical protein
MLCIGICHGRRKKVMSIATAHARQAWPLKIMLIIFLCACLLDESASIRLASRQAWLSLAKVMSRSIAFNFPPNQYAMARIAIVAACTF